MPKQVDHGARRREISRAVADIATTRGLQGVSFREAAVEAGVSVSLVQHYFGTKDRLLIDTLDLQSGTLGHSILDRLEGLGQDARPLERLQVIVRAFLPFDDESRRSMLLYLGYAGAALTDSSLRRAEAFRNANELLATIAETLRTASESGELAREVDPRTEALTIVSMLLGLSLAVLLEQASIEEAGDAIDAYLSSLRRAGS